jgi:hypothetical protein
MKQLLVNDPRFFEQQWLVNCTYYDGMYARYDSMTWNSIDTTAGSYSHGAAKATWRRERQRRQHAVARGRTRQRLQWRHRWAYIPPVASYPKMDSIGLGFTCETCQIDKVASSCPDVMKGMKIVYLGKFAVICLLVLSHLYWFRILAVCILVMQRPGVCLKLLSNKALFIKKMKLKRGRRTLLK